MMAEDQERDGSIVQDQPPIITDGLVRRLYEEGLTYREIAGRLGVSHLAIRHRARRLQQSGVVARRQINKHTTVELAEQLVALCGQGKSAGEIAECLDMHEDAVAYHIGRLQETGCLPSRYANRFRPRPAQQEQWSSASALEWPMTAQQLAAQLYSDDPAGRQRARAVLRRWLQYGRVVRTADGAYALAPARDAK